MEPRIRNSFFIEVTFMMLMIQCALAQLTLVVSQDGQSNFTSISKAVDAAPNKSVQRTVIKIKAGVYYEYVIIPPEKTNLYFVGEGMDNTIITGNRSHGMGLETRKTATFENNANGFVAKDISFQNTAGPTMHQAIALSSYGHHSAFYRCRFIGYQDTLNPQANFQFYRDCEVYGTIDFIFGNYANAVFQNCKIYARKPLNGQFNTITAQGNDNPNKQYGIVLQNCNISGTPDLLEDSSVQTYLGRPLRNHSTTMVMQSVLGKLINPHGWLEWENVPLDHVNDAEYSNCGHGNASIGSRVKWSHLINSTDEAAKYTVRNFIDGETWIKSTGIPYYPDFCIDCICNPRGSVF